MIIAKSKKTFKYLFLNQSIYDSIIKSIDFNKIKCPSCNHNSWHQHCSYDRKFDIDNSFLTIKIIRIKCSHCHKTHSILIESMIPFCILNYNQLIEIIINDATNIISSSHSFYFRKKFKDFFIDSYNFVCTLFKRSHHIIFIDFPT